MRVRCVSNDPKDAKGTYQYLGSNTGRNSKSYALTIGKEYGVYAIAKAGIETTYLVPDDSTPSVYEVLQGEWEPRLFWYDAKLFEVTDSTIDPAWQKAEKTAEDVDELISFPEFIQNGNDFYASLFESDPKTMEILKKYMRKYENPDDLDTEEADKKRAWKKYDKDLQLAKERGWDMPDKPKD